MDWDRLRIFHAVVEAGSFTKAGRALDLSQSAISRQIGALEETLGVALFHRHTRGVVLTEQGDDFHETVREMAAKIEMARARINERRVFFVYPEELRHSRRIAAVRDSLLDQACRVGAE